MEQERDEQRSCMKGVAQANKELLFVQLTGNGDKALEDLNDRILVRVYSFFRRREFL